MPAVVVQSQGVEGRICQADGIVVEARQGKGKVQWGSKRRLRVVLVVRLVI